MNTGGNKLALIAFLLSGVCAHAQSWTWGKTGMLGNPSVSSASSICSDSIGNNSVTGSFNANTLSFSSTTLTNDSAGLEDVYIVHSDPAGTLLWAKSAGGKGNDKGSGVATDRFGNVYVCGSFDSPSLNFGTASLNNTSSGTTDFFLAKYNPSGSVAWIRSGHGSASDEALAVTTDHAGNVCITGDFSSSSLILGTDTLPNSSGSPDVFIAKYDSSGNVLWAHAAGGTGTDFGKGICTDSAGNVFVTGSFASPSVNFGTSHLQNFGTKNFFLVKYTTSGSQVWAKSWGGPGADEANGISSESFGEVYVVGTYSSSFLHFDSTATLVNAGNSNIFLVKMDGQGRILWAKSAGGASQDEGLAVSAFYAGAVYISGKFNSFYMDLGTLSLNNSNPGTDEAFVAEYDGLGNVIFGKCAGGSGNERANGMAADRLGGAYSAGDFTSATLNLGSIPLTNSGQTSLFYAKLSGVTGISEMPFSDPRLMVYPNPMQSSTHFQFSQMRNSASVLELYDGAGSLVRSQRVAPGSGYDFERESLSEGLYFYRFLSEKKELIAQGKLIIE